MVNIRLVLLKSTMFGLSVVGFFLSLWIILPAPTMLLLPLSVGAPEVSPWLLIGNALFFVLALRGARRDRLLRAALGLSTAGLLLSFIPLSQFSTVAQRIDAVMNQAFGSTYLTELPNATLAQMRVSPFSFIDALQGIPSKAAIRYIPNIPFAQPDGVSLKLDVYQPPQVNGSYPAIVMIYGGAWRSGSPTQNAEFSRYMAGQGYVVWAIAYRLAPRYQFPAQIEDVQSALAFIRQHAAEYETNPNRLALMGRSAGAHLAMLAAFSPNAPVRALVDYYGPVDLAAGYRDVPFPDPIDSHKVLRSFLGSTPDEQPELYEKASPISYVTSTSHPLPPSLLVYGGRDHIVQAKYGQMLAQQLNQVGTQAAFLEIPWADHAFDAVFSGVSNQLALYHTERFLAWALK